MTKLVAKLPSKVLYCASTGFFGGAATTNMCSKWHKDMMLKEEQAKLAASSIGNIMNGSSSSRGNEPLLLPMWIS